MGEGRAKWRSLLRDGLLKRVSSTINKFGASYRAHQNQQRLGLCQTPLGSLQCSISKPLIWWGARGPRFCPLPRTNGRFVHGELISMLRHAKLVRPIADKILGLQNSDLWASPFLSLPIAKVLSGFAGPLVPL